MTCTEIPEIPESLVARPITSTPQMSSAREVDYMKGVEMLVTNFEFKPLKKTDLGVAQALFDPYNRPC